MMKRFVCCSCCLSSAVAGTSTRYMSSCGRRQQPSSTHKSLPSLTAAITTSQRQYFTTPALRLPMRSSPRLLAPKDVSEELAQDLQRIIAHDRVVAFLTGTPEAPRCRFTVQLVDLLEQLTVPYGYFNILDDDEVCEGLKQYSDWPTYPQVYVDGELVGGYDVVVSMARSGALTKMLSEKGILSPSS